MAKTTEILAAATTKQLSIPELITMNIPQTHDTGDALAIAVQIVNAAHTAWSREGGNVFEYGVLIAGVKQYLAHQHINYLKTGFVGGAR